MRSMRLAAGLGAACVLLASTSPAQTIRGTLTGTVTDPTAAAVPGVTVTVVHTATGVATSAVTSQQGSYTFPLLSPGNYQATVEQSGFRKYLRSGIVVQIAQTTRLDIGLQIGDLSEAVEVAVEAPLVRSTTAELGQVVEMKQIQALPLNGRLFQHLVGITPGAVARSGGEGSENAAAAGARTNTQYSVNGMPWSGNNYLLDGVANNEPLNSLVNISPPLEAIQEFKVQTNNPTAEFGVFGGAAVNLTIRSGTNEIHGSAFGYLRHDSLNARRFEALEKAPFDSKQFGGTFGGPLIKNKAFFFADYQGMRLEQGRTQILSVPTALMRQGIFTEVTDRIFDPITRQQFPGNAIPAGQINPIARQVASVWPLPNRAGLANNYVENNVVSQRVNAFDVRLDYTLSRQASVFGRYSYAARKFDEPGPAGSKFLGGNNSESGNYNGVLGYTHTFGSNRFYEVRVGFNKFDVEQFGEDFGIDKNNELGIPNGNIAGQPYTSGIANFGVSGFSGTGSPGFTNSVRIGSTLHLTNNFTWIKERHSVKVGADLRLMRSTLTNPENQPRGTFSFDRLNSSNNGGSGTGHAFASFLLGYPNRVQRGFVDTYPKMRRTFLGLFVQDDLRVNRKLTLQLGLRWDLMTPVVEASNRHSNFSLEDGRIHVASADNRGPNMKTNWDYFAPRLGVAYTPDNGKTALRAAFGISYFPDNFGANGGTNERNFPFFQVIDLQQPTQAVPFRSISDGLPGFTPVALSPTLTPPAGFAVFYIPPDFREDTVTMWNVGIQRELGWHTMLDVSYVATRGTNIFRSRNINVPAPGAGNLQQRRPYFALAPTLSAINERDGDGRSWYDAVQVKVDKRISHGLQMLVSYTYSRTEDDVTPIQAIHPEFPNPRMPALSKAIDIPHNLAVSFTYELPFGAGRRFLSSRSGLVGALVEGWSITGITTYQSGDPLDIRVSASRLNTGTANWANVTCGEIGMPKELTKWFDTSCFADPAQFEFGNYRIGDVRGPSVFNTDVSLFKRTAIGKNAFELRIDAFNVFNRAHFSNPNGTFGNAQFGVISTTRLPPREVQLGVRFLF